MAKVHPQSAAAAAAAAGLASSSTAISSSSSCSSTVAPDKIPPPPPSSSKEKGVFTIWLKSLVLGGKGCTVFDSEGQVVYRVDNYNCQSSDQVYLMDSKGKIICSIYRKKFKPFSDWEGYKSHDMGEAETQMRWFQVRKPWTIFKKRSACEVVVNLEERSKPYTFKMERKKDDSACKIMDGSGGVVAETRRKQSVHGIKLGNDVQTLTVEPNTDPSLVMGLVVVQGLIDSKM